MIQVVALVVLLALAVVVAVHERRAARRRRLREILRPMMLEFERFQVVVGESIIPAINEVARSLGDAMRETES